MPPILCLNFPLPLSVLPGIPPYIQILVSGSASGEHQPKTNLSSIPEDKTMYLQSKHHQHLNVRLSDRSLSIKEKRENEAEMTDILWRGSGIFCQTLRDTVAFQPNVRGERCSHYWSGFLDTLTNRNWQEAKWEIQIRIFGDSCCSIREWGQVTNAPAFSLKSGEGQVGPLYVVRIGQMCGLGRRGDLGDLSTPLVVLCAGIMCNTLLLLSEPGKWQLGFGLTVSYCSYFVPTVHACSYF